MDTVTKRDRLRSLALGHPGSLFAPAMADEAAGDWPRAEDLRTLVA